MKAPKKQTVIQRIKILERTVGMLWQVIQKQGIKLQELDSKNEDVNDLGTSYDTLKDK